MNVFLQDYYTRLKEWHSLKEKLKHSDIETICVEVDKFWQQAPLLSHYLHPADIDNWPDPWLLLNDNSFCPYARALGMVYSLMLLGIQNIDLVDAIDDNAVEVVLVLVDDAKYVMNYWPDSVVNTKSQNFKITAHHDTEILRTKIGE